MRSKKAVYNIISTLILQIITIIYGFIVPKIIITSFGSNVNGLVSSITQFLAYITLLESGVGPVIKASLYKPLANKDKQEISNIIKASEKFFKTISYIFLGYLLCLAFIYPLIVSSEFSYFYTLSLIIIISISTFAEYYFGMAYRLYLQAEQKSYIISLIQIITYILSVIIIIILAKYNCSIHIIKLASGIIFILRPILQNIYVKKKYQINLNIADKNYKLKNKWDGLAQHIAAVIHGNTDITILTIFCNLAEVSVYSIYYLVVKGVKSITQAFTGGIDASFGDMIAKGENKNLNKKFNLYEIFYFTIITIIYTCTIILIVPFVKVYTLGINDANYIRPLFGTLLVLSEFVWAIRLPYSSITLAAGHFKETKKGAWIETISNIVISLLLVWKYGIIGVAIGTLVAMSIRTIEFAYHTNKYILNRNIIKSVKKILVIIIEVLLVVFLSNYLPNINIISYLTLIKYAILVLILTVLIVLPINILVFKKEFKEIINILKNIFKKKEKK